MFSAKTFKDNKLSQIDSLKLKVLQTKDILLAHYIVRLSLQHIILLMSQKYKLEA